MENIATDAELWLNIRKGDIDSYNRFSNRYWKLLNDKAAYRVSDRDEAKDLVQEVMISIWLKRDKLPENIIPKAYLITALKYKILNYFNHSNVRMKKANLLLEQKQAEFNPTPEDTLDTKELKNRISESVCQMSPSVREVFELSYQQGLAISEIATAKKLSPQTVKNYLQEAKSVLRKEMFGFLSADQLAAVLVILLIES